MAILLPSFYNPLLYIAVLVIFRLYLQARRYKNIPPGPPSLPIIGNLHILDFQRRPPHHTFRDLSKKYGSVFSLWFGSRLAVVISSHSEFLQCFTKNDIVLANRPRVLSGKYIFYNYSTLGVSSYGENWRNLRRITTLDVLSTHRLDTFAGNRRDETLRLINKLAEDCSEGFVEVELTSKFHGMTINNITRMISGKRYYGDDADMVDVEEAKQFRQMMPELVQLAVRAQKSDFMPMLRLIDFENLEKTLRKMGNKIDAFLQGLIEEHRKKNHHENTMIGHLLSLQKSQPECYTDKVIKGEALGMLIAGTDTSAVTLEWAFSCLLSHPDVLRKARDELETHVGQDRLVDESDLSKLPYLRNIILETLRLYTPGPLLLPHAPSQECTIGGFKVPKDTFVLINAWAIHRDPNLWSEPTSFKPERFDKEGERDKLIAFGLGRRACPGKGLALRSLGLTLGLLIQCFDWKRVDDEKIDMREVNDFILQRLVPLKVMCKARPIVNKVICSD